VSNPVGTSVPTKPAGYRPLNRENIMIDINSILSNAFEHALRPLRQEIALQQSQLRAQHEKIETLEARLQGTQEHVATQVDVLSRSITTLDNSVGMLHTRIEASAAFIVNEEDLNKAIDKGIERHLEEFKDAIVKALRGAALELKI